MDSEDVTSRMLRPYLTCDSKILKEIEMAFAIFDDDGNGYISSGEFQALCFEMGEIMSDREVGAALKQIDFNDNGRIDFHEFAVWWVQDKPNKDGDDVLNDTNQKMLAMKLKMLKRAKTTMVRFRAPSTKKKGGIKALDVSDSRTRRATKNLDDLNKLSSKGGEKRLTKGLKRMSMFGSKNKKSGSDTEDDNNNDKKKSGGALKHISERPGSV